MDQSNMIAAWRKIVSYVNGLENNKYNTADDQTTVHESTANQLQLMACVVPW